MFGGRLTIGPRAHIDGVLNVGGGALTRAPEATIVGGVNTGTGIQLPFELTRDPPPLSEQLTSLLFRAIAVALLATIVGRYAPHAVGNVSHALINHPAVAAAMGPLAGLVGISLFVFMAFTISLHF